MAEKFLTNYLTLKLYVMKVARQAAELDLLRTKYHARKQQNITMRDALLNAGHNADHPEVEAAQAGIDEMQQMQAEINQCYEPLDLTTTEITADVLHEMGYDDWIRLTPDDLKRPYNDIDRIAYENFVQGYLTYFEQNVNQGDPKLDRKYTIYFDWGHTRTGFSLVVYIKPGLDTVIYDDYKRYAAPMIDSAVFNGMQRSPFPPPPSMTDPVKPPPPPPPTQK